MPEPEIAIPAPWENVFRGEGKAALERLLPAYLLTCRWFGGKARPIRSVGVMETVPLPHEAPVAYITAIEVSYGDGPAQIYMLPLAFAPDSEAATLKEQSPEAVLARLHFHDGEHGVLFDATRSPQFARVLLEAIQRGYNSNEITASSTRALQALTAGAGQLVSRVIRSEQSNTSIVYGDRLILKLFRRFEEGVNPDLEIGRFLTERGFANIPPVAGALEYRRSGGDPATLALLQGFVANRGDAWQYTLHSLGGYFVKATAQAGVQNSDLLPRQQHLLDIAGEEVPGLVRDAAGDYLASARLLGRRTAEMHAALASDKGDPDFAPEPLSREYSRSLYEATRRLASDAFTLLGNSVDSLPDSEQAAAQVVADRRGEIEAIFEPLLSREFQAMLTRCHGDYHLGQVLYTGSDFVIIDFEGEPARSLEERRRKHSPLKDVAGMLRSFHYAAYAAMFAQEQAAGDNSPSVAHYPPFTPDASPANLDAWTDAWHLWVSAAFLGEYLPVVEQAGVLPPNRHDLQILLDAYLLEKAIYELLYELNNRPNWVRIPMQGITQLLRT
jgi:trehalose synthase-fused probable maltokinase